MFEKLTVSSGKKKIDKEWGGEYYMEKVWLLMLLLYSAVQDCVLHFYSSRD